MTAQQEDWVKQVKQFELSSQMTLAETQADFENKLKAKSIEIARVCPDIIS